MRRRTLIKVGLVGTGLLGAVSSVVLSWTSGVGADGMLTAAGRDVFRAVARTVLAGSLPVEAEPLNHALSTHLTRLQSAVVALPPPVQSDLAELTTLLATPATRYLLTGLVVDWATASEADLRAAFDRLRNSRSTTRQQIYQALRDLTQAAFYADSASWGAIGYPGPTSV